MRRVRLVAAVLVALGHSLTWESGASPLGSRILVSQEARFALPEASEGEALFPITLVPERDVRSLRVTAVRVVGPDGKERHGTLRLELAGRGVAAAGTPVEGGPAGQPLEGRLAVSTAELNAAGEYALEVVLRVLPGDEAARAWGPPEEIEQTLAYTVTRAALGMTLAPVSIAEVKIDPWDPRIEAHAVVRVSEAAGRMGLGEIRVVERGQAVAARDHQSELALAISAGPITSVAGTEAKDVAVSIVGPAAAGLWELPLEVRSVAASAPVPFTLSVAIKHRMVWLLIALGLGVCAGMLLRGVVRNRRRSEDRVSAIGEARRHIERLVAGAADRPASTRIEAALAKLAKAETRAAWGSGGDPARVVEEVQRDVLQALRDLESRRLGTETLLTELEQALLPSPSDPPEIEAVLREHARRADDLRIRLERGDVEAVEEEVGRLRLEVARSIAEASRRWLVVTRDVLEALRLRIAHAPRVQLTEAVRYPLETLAQRVAEASPEHLRETLLAGRSAATALSEQAMSLAFKPAYRDVTEACQVLQELAGEGALAAAEAARREFHKALESGDLKEPFRAIEALAWLEERLEETMTMLAGGAWEAETWKAPREAVADREYARAAGATDAVLRLHTRERGIEVRRRTRVLEVVRLAPRPPTPRVRIAWDSPPTAGFPVLVRVVWLGLEPKRWSVRFQVEGLPVKLERPNVPTTSMQFGEPGFASLRATVDVDTDPVPLVAHTRIRVLPAPGNAPVRRAVSAAFVWLLAEAALAGTVACGLGYVILGAGFYGTPRDYALAVGFGMASELLVDRLRALAPGSGAHA